VEEGKGLLIMDGSDYASYNFYRVQNKILDALNFGLHFQHDEVEEGALPGQTSSGWDDVFVRKYDSLGNELWTRQFGSSADDHALGVAVDTSGNVYVAGYTEDTLPGQTFSGSDDTFTKIWRDGTNLLYTVLGWRSRGDSDNRDYSSTLHEKA